MTISFPSPNISFASTNITEGPNGLKCSVKTDIVEYAKKDQLTTNPSVTLYFCNNSVSAPSSEFRTIVVGDMSILIQAKDPSWTNFANAITLQ
mgnify:CR=1 FL=1